MSDDELIERMAHTWIEAAGDARACMRAVLAVVREHDGAALAAKDAEMAELRTNAAQCCMQLIARAEKAEQEAATLRADAERLNKLCAQRTEMAQRSFDRAELEGGLLRELVAGLERTAWSSWQTTAHFWTQLKAAQAAIAARAGGVE